MLETKPYQKALTLAEQGEAALESTNLFIEDCQSLWIAPWVRDLSRWRSIALSAKVNKLCVFGPPDLQEP
jgi:hypothetical protein